MWYGLHASVSFWPSVHELSCSMVNLMLGLPTVEILGPFSHEVEQL